MVLVVTIVTLIEVTTYKIDRMGGLPYCLQAMTFYIL